MRKKTLQLFKNIFMKNLKNLREKIDEIGFLIIELLGLFVWLILNYGYNTNNFKNTRRMFHRSFSYWK